ncbi:MAG: DUF2815 family protein [Chitinophagaceae bacterium]|nr:DUF2815 family protein [Chitinophagaceae bacterium]
MTTTKTENPVQKTKVITGKVRLSYAHIFEPQAAEGSDKAKFSASLIIPKSDAATIKKMQAAIKEAALIGKDSKFGGKIPANLKTPLRDGDEDRPEDDAYVNSVFVNASSSTRPGVIDLNRNVITDKEEVYSGCYAIVSVNFYPYNTNGNKGVACGLNNIMKVADGEPLGGRISAEDDFKNVELDTAEDLF